MVFMPGFRDAIAATMPVHRPEHEPRLGPRFSLSSGRNFVSARKNRHQSSENHFASGPWMHLAESLRSGI